MSKFGIIECPNSNVLDLGTTIKAALRTKWRNSHPEYD
jgi:hypothetical protein